MAVRRAMRALMRSYARLDRAATRAQQDTRRFAGGLLCRALTPEEQTDLSIAAYDALHVPSKRVEPLHSWEHSWWRDTLPEPGARVLVGACGDGREAAALAERHYRVDAFDPVERAARTCAARLGPDSVVARASYEQFGEAVAAGTCVDRDLATIAQRTYDAVLLGWGSLGHVLAESARRDLVQACDRVCPRGPILATFWLGAALKPFARSGQLGERLGARIANWRGIEQSPDKLTFGSWFGFNRVFTNAEIDELGECVGRQTQWGDAADAPHVAWVKSAP